MRHPVRSITKRRCDLFKEGSRDAGEAKEGQSFAHKSNNGVIFHAGFVPVVSPSELFARPSLYPGHIRGWPQNKYINFTPRPLPPPILPPFVPHKREHTHTHSPSALTALFRESCLRVYVYAYTYHCSVRVVTTHPRSAFTGAHTHREEVELPPPSARAHIRIATHTCTQRQAHTCTCANARPPAYK